MNDIDTFIRTDYSVMRIVKYNDVRFTETLKIIYCYYRGFYQSTNKPVYVSSVKLAELMGYDNTVTIQSSIKKLEKMCLLECVEAKAGTTRQFITHSINESLCTYPNSKKLVKGTNQDPERPVKPKTSAKVKEEIKQNPMPSAESVETPVPPVMDASEKPSISTVESVEAVTVPHVDDYDLTKWVLDQPVDHEALNQNVESKPQETEEEQYYLGKKYFEMYEDFEVFYHKYPESRLTDNAKDVYRAFIKEADVKIPF